MLNTPSGLRGMVSAPHHLASQAGIAILRQGGTAAEACIAVAATLAVVYPHMNSMGGDSFWLIHEPDGRIHAVNACGGAAARADLSLYAGLDAVPWRGPLAANTVAGTLSGWKAVLESSGGDLSIDSLLEEATGHADRGVPVTAGGADIALAKGDELRIQPGAYAAIFEPEGRPLQRGDLLRQLALAETLRMLARDGLGSFYDGPLADLIADDLASLGSPVSAADLRAHRATRPDPLSVAITGARLYNMAPPTQGLASLLILALFDRVKPAGGEGFDHLHRLVEATKQAFLVRDAHVGDPAYMDIDPQALLDDGAALDAMAARIDPARALPWPHVPAPGDTVWFGAADERGQVASCIQSTYFEFGSGLVLPRTGIIWQNRGASFRLAPDGWNALRPGRKPFHTLNPALARFDDGRVMAYGTMGGEGQPQTQAAIFTRYADYGLPPQQAVSAPRWLLGRTWGEDSTTLKLEAGFPRSLLEALGAAGHEVETVPAFSSTMGHAGMIVRHPSGLIEGASDPRSDGAAIAL
ncbi:MAG: gamma-glutamyltransferase family protein [Sphingobium sp.]